MNAAVAWELGFHMERESKPLNRTRAAALLVTVILHGLLIFWALSLDPRVTQAIPGQAIQVVLIEKPERLHAEAELSPLQMTQLEPVLRPVAAPNINIPIEPPPPQAVASETTSDTNASIIASNGIPSISSEGSGYASNGEGDITVAHRVQPIYSDASVRAHEEGYVIVELLIDEHGTVRKAQIQQSSGFRRLDQSALDALRQWTFKREGGAPSVPTRISFRYGFHLAFFNAAIDLSAMDVILLPYDPELAEQIRSAALPTAASAALKPKGGAALRRLIEAIRSAAPTLSRDFLAPQQLVIKLGAVKSLHFLNFEKQGLEVDAAHQPAANSTHKEQTQWEIYKVDQAGGASEWLIEVTRSGSIRTAQALTCTSEGGVIKCP